MEKYKVKLTSSIPRHMCPPLTGFSMNVVRARSIKRSALAIHRKASLDASGSSLKVAASESSVDKLAGEDKKSEPEGSFPRVLTAKRACAASQEL